MGRTQKFLRQTKVAFMDVAMIEYNNGMDFSLMACGFGTNLQTFHSNTNN